MTDAAPSSGGPVGFVLGPFGRLLGGLLKILGIFLVIGILLGAGILGYRYFIFSSETGQLSSVVTHTGVAAEETLNPLQKAVKKVSPTLYYVMNPGQYNPLAIDSDVEYDLSNKNLGVKVNKFETPGGRNFFSPNTEILLLGKVGAGGFKDKSYDIEVYCSLESYKNGILIPGKLLGAGISGNKGTVYPGTSREFTAECRFPGISVIKQITPQEAKLVVVYNFLTKTYSRMWFINNQALADIDEKGLSPFDIYKVNDPLLKGDRIASSRQTPGPINLGLSVPFAQPLTSGAEYNLLVQVSRTLEQGDLQTLKSLKLTLPSVNDLDIAINGEKEFGLKTGSCDFEYLGQAENGYKEYGVIQSKLEEVNQNCDKKTLKDLALSQSECISIFKQPLFTCDFIVTKVPELGLQSDIFSTNAEYTIKVEKKLAFDIRATPQQIVTS